MIQVVANPSDRRRMSLQRSVQKSCSWRREDVTVEGYPLIVGADVRCKNVNSSPYWRKLQGSQLRWKHHDSWSQVSTKSCCPLVRNRVRRIMTSCGTVRNNYVRILWQTDSIPADAPHESSWCTSCLQEEGSPATFSERSITQDCCSSKKKLKYRNLPSHESNTLRASPLLLAIRLAYSCECAWALELPYRGRANAKLPSGLLNKSFLHCRFQCLSCLAKCILIGLNAWVDWKLI